MKKNLKKTFAKATALAMAVAMMVSVVPANSADAKAKKPKLAKSVKVTVKKTKKVKIKNTKTIKKTKWSIKSKKVATLSKKKKTSVVVKGKKAGSTKLTAKLTLKNKKKKTLKMTVKVVKAKPPVTPTPKKTPTPKPTEKTTTGPNPTAKPDDTKPTPEPTDTTFKNGAGVTMTVKEKDTYHVALTELNETILTSDAKQPEPGTTDAAPSKYAREDATFNRDGSVTFTSNTDYNSGMSFYVNPCTSASDLIDLSDTKGEGYFNFRNGEKDMSAYDYIRIKLTSENEMNLRTYNGIESLEIGGAFTDKKTSETYEGGWIGPVSSDTYMESDGGTGKKVKEEYATRTLFIPIADLVKKGMNPATLAAIAFCPQRKDMEVTIHSIDFVKVRYDTPVTGITVTASKTELANGKSTTCEATITPENATRQLVEWSSSNEELATVAFNGKVTAAAEGKGTVTITATATDGSDKKGEIEFTIGEAAQPPAATNINVPLTAATKYADGCLENEDGTECTPVYGADGSVTYTSSNQYNGGGMAFYFKASKEAVDLSEYSGIQIVIEGTSGKEIKLTPYTNETPDNYLNSAKVADDYGLTMNGEEQTYTLDFEKDDAARTKWGSRGEAYALGIIYSAYNESQGAGNSYDDGNKLYATIKVKSVTLIKKATQPPVATDIKVPLTAATKYADGCLENEDGTECTPEYAADGSVTYTSSNQYNGGGMAFYFNADKEAVDLSEYEGIEIVIEGTSGKEIKLTPYTNETPDNYLNSAKVADDYGLTMNGEEQTYTLDFNKDTAARTKWGSRGEAYALGIIYSAYNESQGAGNSYDDGNKLYATITVKSVTLIKSAAKVPLTAATKYSDGCLENEDGTECTPVYGADGSVTYTSSNQYNGGGMAFYFNADKEAVDLSEYEGIRIVIEGTSGKEIKLTPYTNETPDNYLNSTKVADDYGLTMNGEEQTYILDFEKDAAAKTKWGSRGEAYALGIIYSAYNESQGAGNSYDDGNKLYAAIQVKSVTLLKKVPNRAVAAE